MIALVAALSVLGMPAPAWSPTPTAPSYPWTPPTRPPPPPTWPDTDTAWTATPWATTTSASVPLTPPSSPTATALSSPTTPPSTESEPTPMLSSTARRRGKLMPSTSTVLTLMSMLLVPWLLIPTVLLSLLNPPRLSRLELTISLPSTESRHPVFQTKLLQTKPNHSLFFCNW